MWFSRITYERKSPEEREAYLDEVRRKLPMGLVFVFGCEGEPSPLELL